MRSGLDWENRSSEEIAKLLKDSKSIAVIGLSGDVQKPSHGVAAYLQKSGYRIYPVNPTETEILGERSYSDLNLITDSIDIVDVFRRPSEVISIVEQAIEIGAKGVWLQESVISAEAFKKGEEAGLFMVMDRCLYKEHVRLLKG